MKPYEVIAEEGRAPIKLWTRGVDPVEASAMQQLRNVASLPFIYKHVAVMPDVHWGIGATVGSVIPTRGAIIPAAVGVDLGCGMVAARLNLTASDLPDSLGGMRSAIEAAVPHGRTNDGRPGDRGAWADPPQAVLDTYGAELVEGHKDLIARHPKLSRANALSHLCSLGTGNHFIEVCLDGEQRVWAMLHSGSRGIGNAIGTYFIALAKEDMRRFFVNLPDEDLAYLPQGTEHFNDYLKAVSWAQRFARLNRSLMLDRVIEAISTSLGWHVRQDLEAVNCHHNYVAEERHFGETVWLTRKGAVSAKAGELGIIPGSMGARSFIVRGKGNPESFMSCSHGAGRRMSRGEAKRRFTVADHEAATAGVECRKDAGVVDETPGAYKDIESVMAAQADLVEVVATLKQVLCVKG